MNLVNSKLHIVEAESTSASVKKDLENKAEPGTADFKALIAKKEKDQNETNTGPK